MLLYKQERVWNWKEQLKIRTNYLIRNIVAFLIKLVQRFKEPFLELKMITYHSSLFYLWRIDLFVQGFRDALSRNHYGIHQLFVMVVAFLLIWLMICPVKKVKLLFNNTMKGCFRRFVHTSLEPSDTRDNCERSELRRAYSRFESSPRCMASQFEAVFYIRVVDTDAQSYTSHSHRNVHSTAKKWKKENIHLPVTTEELLSLLFVCLWMEWWAVKPRYFCWNWVEIIQWNEEIAIVRLWVEYEQD